MSDPINYNAFTRDQWKAFANAATLPLTQESLRQIKAFNDRISLQDVQDIYIPLIHLLRLQVKHYQLLQRDKASFLHQKPRRVPFIIGIAGSVAVGKSTAARLLEVLLNHYLPNQRIQLITTDGFLYSNQELKQRNLMARKGFPESYDMSALIRFLNAVKGGEPLIKAPVYSHKVYDIVPDQFDYIVHPDILIVEGINTLQLPTNEQIYVSDFTDFSIYVDADPTLIESWFLERFELLLETAFQDPVNYYYPYAIGDHDRAMAKGRQVWHDIDLKNLEEYILPTRNRADMIIHKTFHHRVDRLLLRKY
ncbi:type I pantothenate kinase [Levilactobacillus suantsaii]|uniref:Pantothenate kinase n=1 Tax=Levilactobacillus suantsaii TaxID=2292255 RepID=A0A4Q0VGV3_9LACO|nr:type I pantothenate kinase [Levilactobacillus suantsaii]QMU08084.1 type I pantothenate kinase [Levilactobacillus suantsaii]RXI77607.1 type I pantothenate kinase [Levilactobacillus suantsaii]